MKQFHSRATLFGGLLLMILLTACGSEAQAAGTTPSYTLAAPCNVGHTPDPTHLSMKVLYAFSYLNQAGYGSSRPLAVSNGRYQGDHLQLEIAAATTDTTDSLSCLLEYVSYAGSNGPQLANYLESQRLAATPVQSITKFLDFSLDTVPLYPATTAAGATQAPLPHGIPITISLILGTAKGKSIGAPTLATFTFTRA